MLLPCRYWVKCEIPCRRINQWKIAYDKNNWSTIQRKEGRYDPMKWKYDLIERRYDQMEQKYDPMEYKSRSEYPSIENGNRKYIEKDAFGIDRLTFSQSECKKWCSHMIANEIISTRKRDKDTRLLTRTTKRKKWKQIKQITVDRTSHALANSHVHQQPHEGSASQV